MKKLPYIEKGASISADGKYRYRLWREWRGTGSRENYRWWGVKDGAEREIGEPKSCVFIMLNPSTADGELDDPTIRRCVGFAQALHYDRLEVVNLFAYRATDPTALLALNHTDDPVGHRNQDEIEKAIEDAGIIICAWGAHGDHIGQDETVLGWLGARKTFALGLTKDGHPRHPLYLAAAATPIRFNGRRAS